MADFKLEPWEREPLWLKAITPFLRKKRFPYLTGKPDVGKWYRLDAPDCVAANGEKAYADFQLGSENKLLIFFQGGGLSWNEYTAARPSSLYSKHVQDSYYMIHVDLFTDVLLSKGIFSNSEHNPFHDWSKLVIPYCTGDFHCGTGDFPYIAQDGTRRVCHHHGYTNFHALLEEAIRFVPSPEALLVCGCSGGGFGTALLTDSILKAFPGCENMTCCVDSGFFPMDGWHDIAQNVWRAPKEICDRIHSDNITLDVLQALKADHGNRVKILLASSVRDKDLARMLNLAQNGSFAYSEESGKAFEAWLVQLVAKVQATIPNAGWFLFDITDKNAKKMNLTMHCILGDRYFFENKSDGITCAEWLFAAVNGTIETVGQNLLQ